MLGYVRKVIGTLIATAAMLVASSIPASADYQALSIIGNPLASPTAPYLILNGLVGQSACTISILSPLVGTLSVEGLYRNTTNAQWTAPLTVYSPDGTTTVGPSIAAPGNYIFNCGNMSSVRADGSGASGAPSVTLNASGGINVIAHIPGGGGGGSVTAVTATGPIVSSGGTTPNISCPTCAITGGTITKYFQVVASSSPPWEATVNFAPAFTTTPVCVATSFSAVPISTVLNIVSESTTSAVVYDSSHTGFTCNVQCTGT